MSSPKLKSGDLQCLCRFVTFDCDARQLFGSRKQPNRPSPCRLSKEIELGNKQQISPFPRTPSLRSYVEMNERKVKSPNSATGHHQGHSQQRSITPHQRGQTPPQYTGRGPEDVPQQFYPQQAFVKQPFNIPPPPQGQGQSTGYPHDLKQSQVPPRLSAQGAGLVQPATMYQQQNMRPQGSIPFYRQAAPTGNVINSNQYQQMAPPPNSQYSQTGGMAATYQLMTGPGQNFPIIMQQQLSMQPPRIPNSQYPNMGNSSQQSVHFTMGQPPTTQTYYNNPTMLYNPQPNRPPSNPPLQSEKRVKKTIMITDPNTGKDLTNEILHTRESKEGASHTSTPPSGQGSGSRGTPDTTAPPPQVTQNSNIAAQFAAQVAATLRSEARSGELAGQPENLEEPQVDSSTLASEVSDIPTENDLTTTVTEHVESAPSKDASNELIAEDKSSSQSLSNNVLDSTGEESSKEPNDLSVEKSEASVPITGNEPPSLSTSTAAPSAETTLSSKVQASTSDVLKKESVSPLAPEQEEKKEVVQQKEKASSEDVSRDVKPEPATEVQHKETADVKKNKKKAKDFNKKDMSGTDMDAFVDSSPSESESRISVEEKKEAAVPVQAEVPKVEIKIEDENKVVQEENEKNQEKNKEANESSEADKSAPELKYKYKEDQWSPLNPEGKRLYDRDFLLSVQYSSESTQKPAGLPDLPEIILDKPHSSQSNRSSFSSFNPDPGRSSFDFTPGFVRGGPSRGPSMTKRGSSQRNQGGGATPRKVISIGSITQDVALHKAESAWKPGRKQDQAEVDEDTKKTEELYKKVRSILNKLTPQKFQTLVKQVSEMEINTEERLKGVTDLIFEKAISEPGFSVAYASMCRYLAMIKVASTSKQGEYVNFRAILLTRCQKEFEKDKDSEKEMEERRKIIAETQDPKKREELCEELEFSETKARRRSLGNIRFIGELFNLKMLTENIMHDCLFKLLRAKDEESLECLCRLLSTIGKELDTDKARPRMDQYFNQMDKIVQEKKTSSRVRFMLQDVIDLRKCKWIPRRDENNPKTLDQIHKEAQKEEQERQIFLQQATAQQKAQGGRGGGARGSRGPPGSGMGASDGWNTVGKPNIRVERQSIDPSRLKLTKQNLDESNIQLGPGGGTNRFSGWQRGSTGGGARNSVEQEKSNAPSNRFSALSKPEDDSRGRFGTSPARGDGRGRGSGGFGRPQRGITPRSSMEQEKERALAAVRDVVGGQTTPRQGQSRESSRGREPHRVDIEKSSKPAPPTAKELTDEEMEKKTKTILDEYLHLQDIKEAILCVEELKSPSVMHTFVSSAVNYVLERSSIARNQTGLLLHDLVKKDVLSVPVYIQGLTEVIQYAEDMEIDIPKIWQYFGELIGPMVQDGSVPLNFLRKAAEPLKENNKAGLLVAEVLHAASHREGHKKVGSLWRQSSLQWEDFMPAGDVKKFIIDKKVEFTAGDDSQPSTPTVSISIEAIQDKLHQLLIKQKADNEVIFDWIEESVDDPTMKSNKFIRALMTSVCESAITGSGSSARVLPEVIKNRGDLLQKYLDHRAESELQALYALQALVHKLEHPQGVLRTLFDTLYDEDIISEDGFNQWEKSKDPNEQEGKGVAMKQVVQFFTWLREAEDEGSDS